MNPSSAYTIKLTSLDNDGNESTGASVTGYTLLDNPTGLTVNPYSGQVDLSWSAVQPSANLQEYRVYMSISAFTSVEGMTLKTTAASTTAKIAGLTNGTPYFFAVTAVNKSGGERKEVTAVTATPSPDTQGTEVSNLKLDGTVFTSGGNVNKSGTFTVTATDPAGISKVEFLIDGTLISTDYSADYTCTISVEDLTDGTHTLTVKAYDTLGNFTSIDYSFTVALAVPPAPVITSPTNNTTTNIANVTITGTAQKNTTVTIYNNDVATTVTQTVGSSGTFSVPFTLSEGQNRLRATASNRAGDSPLSSEVLVTLDTTVPPSPTNLTAQAKESGQIGLTWQAPAGASVKGYNLYRSSSSFTSTAQAQKANTNLITTTSFTDLPATDGTWYYRVVAISQANNPSEPSNEASITSDRGGPTAIITYTPSGIHDPATGRMAPGVVEVKVVVSEPLQAPPFLSIVPYQGVPASVQLSGSSYLTYTGYYTITNSTPTGTATALFSGRDAAGNRGTTITSGETLKIDTDGPAVARIVVQPESPVKNDQANPATLTVTLGLSEAVKQNTTPVLSYLLSADGRTAVAISPLPLIATAPGDAQTWQATFTLLGDAGLNSVETFRFVFEATDDLDNTGNSVTCSNLFQVYQGELPPLDAPTGLKAIALPGGEIELFWTAVSDAVGYMIYRKAQGESDLSEYQRIDSGVSMVDAPAAEGLYTYAVCSIRSENGQESLSGQSAPVSVNSDATAPEAPTNLTAVLISQGIRAQWTASSSTEPVTYCLYRANATTITSVAGLTPILSKVAQLATIDPTPSPTEHCYVVTAKDAAGNESAPSNSSYLNFSLLPVASIAVVQTDYASPVVTWTHPGGAIAGYDFYIGPEATKMKMNAGLLTQQTYTDNGYADDERRYTIVAVDANQQQSLGRSIVLPKVSAVLADGETVKRGIMNTLTYNVTNSSNIALSGVRLVVGLGGRTHTSEPFTIEPNSAKTASVVVGGYADLLDVSLLTTTIDITPTEGEHVQIVRKSSLQITDGMLVLQVENDEFIRGGNGTVRFSLQNTGDEEIEIVTATSSGIQPSTEIRADLRDMDGNILATKSFTQSMGTDIVSLANGNVVARIGAGKTFVSAPLSIIVPASAPNQVEAEIVIDKIYYHQGRVDQVVMNGLRSSLDLSLTDTSYYGEIISITPETSTGDQDIIVTGQAIDRATEMPLAGVPLNLVITVSGFERTSTVYAGQDGTFSRTFIPLANECGVYKVRAMHPDRLDKPVQGQFVITKVGVTPTTVDLSIPKNYEKKVSLTMTTGEGTEISNLRVLYDELDQPSGTFAQGVHITPDAPVALVGSLQRATTGFTVWADNTAAETSTIVLKVASDEKTWATVTAYAKFSAASPVLQFTPNYVETGVALDGIQNETVTLKNTGLAAMNDVTVSVLSESGSPAPSWVMLNSAQQIGTIEVGQARQVSLAFSPTSSVSEGLYHFILRVQSSNYASTDINLYCAITQSGIGSVLFKVSDIYTGTVDKATSQIIQGLRGARITVQNERVITETQTLITDALGEVLFSDLPAGTYKFRAQANNHQEQIGRIWIKPGITTTQDVFLSYNLVTVEWQVTETTIQDKYEIVLNATYETDVPAPVVVIEPTSITLPDMKAGNSFNGEITLTNHGLIRAQNLAFTLPSGGVNFKYELLGGLPTSLEAKQRVTIPYRITCIKALGQVDEQGSGGGCSSYFDCMNVGFEWVCINGRWEKSSVKSCFSKYYGCTGSTAPTAPASGGSGSAGGGGGSGGSSGTSPQGTSVGGVKCLPEPPPPCCPSGECPDEIERCDDQSVSTGSAVNTMMRQYTRDHTDLSVKVPGGTVEAKRWFYKWNTGRYAWRWDDRDKNLTIVPPTNNCTTCPSDAKILMGSLAGAGGVEYTVASSDASTTVYKTKTYRNHQIVYSSQDNTYLWTNGKGAWRLYNEAGKPASYGDRNGTIGKLVYETGASGRLTGIADRNDNQVIWYEYNADGTIAAVRDAHGRRVEYAYTADAAGQFLTSVKDVMGNLTTHTYDDSGRMTRATEPNGRQSNISYSSYDYVVSVLDENGKGYFFDFDYNSSTGESYAMTRYPSGMVKEVWYDRDFKTRRVNVNGVTVKSIATDTRSLIYTDENGYTTRKEFDEWGKLTRVGFADGGAQRTEYENVFHKPIRKINEQGVITEFAYDANGNMTIRKDAVGTGRERTTQYTYNALGNQTSIRVLGDAGTAESLTTMTYDGLGNMTSMTDPENKTTGFTYDDLGNMLTRTDARDKTWEYTYDAAGRVKTVTDPLERTTEFFYDAVGNKIREVAPDTSEKTFAYDTKGNMTSSTDEGGHATVFDYNADGKLIGQTDAEGKVINYEYDTEGRLIRTIDGNGNVTAMEYVGASASGCSTCSGGSSGQVRKITYPTFAKEFRYDTRGRRRPR